MLQSTAPECMKGAEIGAHHPRPVATVDGTRAHAASIHAAE